MTNPIRILLVEDNPADADLIGETLAESGRDFAIEVAQDGAEALLYLNREEPYADAPRPDLILLDLNLPKVHGKQILAVVKNHLDLRGIPMVILSSSASERDVGQCYALGANCYVVKPVSLQAFRDAVRSIDHFWFATATTPHTVTRREPLV